MTQLPTLPEWLLARIAEDIGLARQVQAQAVTDRIDPDDPRLPHLTLAARVLAGCDAKRRVVEYAVEHPLPSPAGDSKWDTAQAVTLAVVLRLLALPYADRPGYRDEWRP